MTHRSLRDFRGDDAGATSIEYALIGALMCVAVVAGLALMGPALQGIFQRTIDLIPS